MIHSMGRTYNRSSQDERELQEAIAIANVFAKQSAHSWPASMLDPLNDNIERPRVDSECSDTSPNSRSRFSLRKRSPRSERSSYCDEIERRKSDISEDMTPEAQEAYNILVVAGTQDSQGRERDRNRSNRERRRQRSLEHQQGDSTIDRARNVNKNIRDPQGIPLRRSIPSTEAGEEEDTNPLRRLRASQGRIPPRTLPRPTSVESDSSARSDTVNGSSRTENIRRPNLVPRSQFKLVPDSSSDTCSSSQPQNSPVPLPPRKPLRPGTINNKPRERKYPLDLGGVDPATRERTTPTPSQVEAANAEPPALPKKQTCRTTPEANANVVTEQPTKGQFPSLVDASQFCVKNVRSTALQMGFEDADDSFWTRKVNFEEFQFEGDSDVPTTIHYRTSDSVSYEDLMEYALDGNDQKRASKISRGARPRSGDSQISDEIRLMRKVLTKDVTLEDCMMGLEETQWDVHQAIKYLKLKQLLSAELADMDTCKWALVQCKWSVQEAANFLIANPPNQESPECVNV